MLFAWPFVTRNCQNTLLGGILDLSQKGKLYLHLTNRPQVTETIFNVKTYFSSFLSSEALKWHFPQLYTFCEKIFLVFLEAPEWHFPQLTLRFLLEDQENFLCVLGESVKLGKMPFWASKGRNGEKYMFSQ